MKCAITESTTIQSTPKDLTEIHLVRPIKKEKIEWLLNNRPLTKITLSSSCLKRLPKKTQKKIKDKGASISIEKRRGRPIDLPLEKIREIIELRKDYQSIRDIERITDVPKSTIHYLLKYAERTKIKKGNTIVYLK